MRNGFPDNLGPVPGSRRCEMKKSAGCLHPDGMRRFIRPGPDDSDAARALCGRDPPGYRGEQDVCRGGRAAHAGENQDRRLPRQRVGYAGRRPVQVHPRQRGHGAALSRPSRQVCQEVLQRDAAVRIRQLCSGGRGPGWPVHRLGRS